jgi:hypothetical protein
MVVKAYYSSISDPVDGAVNIDTVNRSWAYMQSASGTGYSEQGTLERTFLETMTGTSGDVWKAFTFGICMYDTSDLAGATVTAATWKVVVTAVRTHFTSDIVLVAVTPESTTYLEADDFNRFVLGTAFSTPKAPSAFTADSSTYNDVALNAAGIAAIDTGGVTKLGSTLESFRTDSEPSLSGGGYKGSEITWAPTEEVLSGDKRQKLEVTYTPAFTSKAMMF